MAARPEAWLLDLVVRHAHSLARFERAVVDEFADAVVGAWDRLVGDSVPARRELPALVREALEAGLAAVRPLALEIVLAHQAAVRRPFAARLPGVAAERAGDWAARIGLAPGQLSPDQARELVDLIFARRRSPLHSVRLRGRLVRQVRSALSEELAAGHTVQQIGRRLRDILGDERAYEAYARTFVQEVNQRAHDRWLKDHRHLLRGVQYRAILDTRTCMVCGPADGQTYWFRPQRGQASYASRPMLPRHLRCRCQYVPITKSLRDFGLRRKDVPSPVARLLTGRLPPRETYAQWLGRQPPTVQRAVMGTARYAAYQAGVPITRFVVGGELLPIDELPRAAARRAVARPAAAPPETSELVNQVVDDTLAAAPWAASSGKPSPLLVGASLEAVGLRAPAAELEQALAVLSPAARGRAKLVRRSLAWHTPDAPRPRVVPSVGVAGLDADQTAAVAERLLARAPDLHLRLRLRRPPELAHRPSWLWTVRARGGYVEALLRGRRRGAVRVYILGALPR